MSKYYKAQDVDYAIRMKYAEEKSEEREEVISEICRLISELPTIEVSEDCISRKWLEEHKEVVSYKNEWYETEIDEFVSWENIENAPSVVPTGRKNRQVERAEGVTTEQSSKVGEWIDHYYPYFEVAGIECSVCGEDVPYWQRHYEKPNYCPNCGAKMKGADE